MEGGVSPQNLTPWYLQPSSRHTLQRPSQRYTPYTLHHRPSIKEENTLPSNYYPQVCEPAYYPPPASFEQSWAGLPPNIHNSWSHSLSTTSPSSLPAASPSWSPSLPTSTTHGPTPSPPPPP